MRNNFKTVSILGLGYVGLPLAIAFAEKGVRVTGIDKSSDKVKMLKSGISYVEDISNEELEKNLGNIRPTMDFSILSKSETVIICVPTPLSKTKEPNISYIITAAREVAKHLHRGMLIVLESTTYPGTTEEVLKEAFEKRGLKVGKDFCLAFSPERVDPGNKLFNVKNTPKIVGGVTDECTKMATSLYQKICESVVPVSSASAAEAVKLLENTFRAINIGLVNEFAQLCHRMKLDVWEIIDAASTKPFGFMPFTPGPGIGGHCIPVDPLYLSWKAKLFNFRTRFIELADEINSKMPEYVVYRIFEVLNGAGKSIKGSKILILGVSYKKDVGDVRESPNLEVMRLLLEKGAEVMYNDPFVPEFPHFEVQWRSQEINPGLLSDVDCVVTLTNHSSYNWEMIARHSNLLLDTRNCMNGSLSRNIFKL